MMMIYGKGVDNMKSERTGSGRFKGENGAVMFISVFAITVFILLTAFVIDYGLYSYKASRMQNAVDSAATAVASQLDATDSAQQQTAANYLIKNGIDYDPDTMEIIIEKKGILSEETTQENADAYITSGYLKVTVKTDYNSLFGSLVNMEPLTKHSFVKVNANYIDKPRALNYTLFAGSSNGTAANPAMQINGRTGTAMNAFTSGLENVINGINRKFIQPIKGWFGGDMNYADIDITTSSITTNGDVHSNSNIRIGGQQLIASRTKDKNLSEVKRDSSGNPVTKKDSNGNVVTTTKTVVKTDSDGNPIKKTDDNGNPVLDRDGNYVYETEQKEEPVYEYENYTQSVKENNSYNDYGQVTYTAVKDITFSSTVQNKSTHVKVQNQQKIEQTQTALTILNLIDYSNVSSTSTLVSQYTSTANTYFISRGSAITETQKKAILDQADNLVYDSGNITFNNQEMIEYDIDFANANAMLEQSYEDSQVTDDSQTASTDGATVISNRLTEQLKNNEDTIYKAGTTELLFGGQAYLDADQLDDDGIDYDVTLSDDDGTTRTVSVNGIRLNRDYLNTGSEGTDSDYSSTSTSVGAKYAVYQTFQQKLGATGYIATPNMKPYFMRQTFKSVANVTRTKESFTDGATQKTIKTAVSDLTADMQKIADATTFEDDKYSDVSDSLKKDTTVFFKKRMTTKSGGLVDLDETDSTTMNGYSLYDKNDVLKSPSDFVEEFKKNNIAVDNKGESNYGKGAIKRYYNNNIANTGSDKATYATNYADDAVQKKKKTISGNFENVDDKKSSVTSNATYMRLAAEAMPSKTDVFLGPAGTITGVTAFTKRSEFNDIINYGYTTRPEIKALSSYNESHTFSIDDYMPTVNTSAKTVTASANASLGGGITTVSGLSNASRAKWSTWSQVNFLDGLWITSANYTDTSHFRLSESSKSVLQGNFNVPKSYNIELYANSTFVVTGNLTLTSGSLQLRSGSVLVVLGDLETNNLEMSSGAKLYVKGNINVKSGTTISDSGHIIYSGGNAVVKGASIGTGSQVKAPGNVTVGDVTTDGTNLYTGTGVLTCANFTTSGDDLEFVYNDFTSSGQVTLSSGAKMSIWSTASFKNVNLQSGSNIVTNNAVTISDTVKGTDNSGLYANGKLTAKWLGDSDSTLVLQGTGIEFTEPDDKSTTLKMPCRIESYGDITAKCFVSVESDAVILSTGSVSFGGWHESSKDSDGNVDTGCDMKGKMYIVGDFTVTNCTRFYSSELYVCGDFNAATSTGSSTSNAIQIEGACKIYVCGQLTTASGKNRHIYMKNGSSTESTVLSVFGFTGSYTSTAGGNPIDDNIVEICNVQSNSVIYLGDGNIYTSVYKADISLTNTLSSCGSLYCYGSLSVTGSGANVSLDGAGKTLIAGSLTVGSGSSGGNLEVKNGHTLVVKNQLQTVKGNVSLTAESKVMTYKTSIAGTLSAADNSYYITTSQMSPATTGSVTLSGGSKMWSLYTTSVNGSITVESSSADNKSDFFSYGVLTISSDSADLVINGKYLTPNTSDFTVGSLQVKQYGEFNYLGSITAKTKFKVEEGGLLYVAGKVYLLGQSIENDGKMYLMGGLDNSNSTASINTGELVLGENADTFIASNASDSIGTLTLKGYFVGKGNVYIENNLVANGSNGSSDYKCGNRNTAIAVASGNTYVSGSVTLLYSEALRVNSGASFSCEGDVNMSCTIYNYGKLYIYGNLNVDWSKTEYISDRAYGKDMRTGISLKNGDTYGSKAALYIGGSKLLTFYGYVVNYGSIYSYAGMETQGWGDSGDNAMGFESAFSNFSGAVAHFGGGVNLNSNGMLNDIDSVFSCVGDYTYGQLFVNCGKFIVTGSIEMNKNTKNTAKWDQNYFSATNGIWKVNGTEYKDSTIYVGGDFITGPQSGTGGGSYITMGNTFVGGSLKVNAGRMSSHWVVSIWAYNRSNTFVGGDVYGGAGVATGNYSIFMCGGNYESRRSTKINVEMYTFYNAFIDTNSHYAYSFCDDESGDKSKQSSDSFYDMKYLTDSEKSKSKNEIYRYSYFYVGGNMLCNTIGGSLWSNTQIWTLGTLRVPNNMTRDTDIYSNANVYVGGSMYCNSKLNMKQNVNLVIDGKTPLDVSRTDYIINIPTIVQLVTTASGATVMKSVNSKNCALYVWQSMDENIASKLVVHGNMHVRDTLKMRDMSKNYIYGDLTCNNYVEMGKSLKDDTEDRSLASIPTSSGGKFWTDGDSLKTYTFANAGYTYVGGDYMSRKYNKIYASTTLRVKGNYQTARYVSLRHDAKLYVGKNMQTIQTLGSAFTGGSYIQGGSYSEIHVNGYMKSGSYVQIRDCTTVQIGGNLESTYSIELGQTGDYLREVKTVDGKEVVTETTSKGVTEGEEPEYTDPDEGDGGGETDTGSEKETDTGETKTEADVSQTVQDAEDELANDASDLSKGGKFYVGGSMATYLRYITVYAYSQVAVGGYVFTPDCLEVRHNADVWALPEAFENITYKYKPYVSQSDGTLWGNIKDKFKELSYELTETFKPKNGSIYALNMALFKNKALVLNKNASVMGTYDCIAQGQTLLDQASLIYMGHDFRCGASAAKSALAGLFNGSYTGFDARGTASGSDSKTAFPVLIYADHDIDINTTINMKLTYLIANKGDVNLTDIYSNSDNASNNLYQLPNAVCSYQGDINYFAMYGKISALFYAPNGNLDLDGYYQDIWGCGIGDTVTVNTYYLNLHRFVNWDTMNLKIAESDDIFLVSESEYDSAGNKSGEEVIDMGTFDLDDSKSDTANGGASLFFSRDILDNLEGSNY